MSNLIPIPKRNVPSANAQPDLPPADGQGLGETVGQNLKRLRTRGGYSLEQLAQLSGVSRAMLSQIELGRSIPSINIAFKIARAFGVPFSALLDESQNSNARILTAGTCKVLTSASGAFSTRALFPFDAARKTEFYELRLAAGATETAEAHPTGTVENIVVVTGLIVITTKGRQYRLSPGDAMLFEADSVHSYSNLAEQDALLYLVMTYSEALP
jgi:transcriptional regulator with XRE-family HTH domain